MTMNTKLIKTEEEYQQALNRLDELFDAPIGTPESDEADVLALLVDDYEKKHYAIDTPDPIEAIKFMMEQNGLLNSLLIMKKDVTLLYRFYQMKN